MKNFLCWFLIILGVSTLAFTLGRSRLTARLGQATTPQPVLSVPEQLSLGPRRIGSKVEAVIPVRNEGLIPLQIEHLRMGCGCGELLIREPGKGLREATSVTVPPASTIELVSRFAVAGRVGVTQRYPIWFHTNDPSRSSVRVGVTVTPTADCFTIPATLALGNILSGKGATNYLDVYSGNPGREVRFGSARTALPHITITNLPRSGGEHLEGTLTGTHIGRLAVSVSADAPPGEIQGNLEIYDTDDEKLATVPITGRVSPLIECQPPSLSLPRQSANGPIYTAVAICRASDDTPFTLRIVGDTPAWLRAEIGDVSGNGAVKLVKVDCGGLRDNPLPGPTTVLLQLECHRGDDRHTHSLELRIQPEDRQVPDLGSLSSRSSP